MMKFNFATGAGGGKQRPPDTPIAEDSEAKKAPAKSK